MTDITNVVETMTDADLAIFMKQIQGAAKARKEARDSRYAEVGREFFETVLTDEPLTVSEKSAWVGVALNGLPLTVDGTQYTVSLTITDVAAKKAREAEKKAAEKTTVSLAK